MQNENKLRLTQFEVHKLFGEHDYCIPLRKDSHVTAIIAPNGAGKTLCLRLIAAFFSQKWSQFADVNFAKLVYSFSDGSLLTVTKNRDDENRPDVGRIEITLSRGNSKTEKWSPKRRQQKSQIGAPIERYLPFVTRIGHDRWQHDATGQVFSFDELVEAHRADLPPSIIDAVVGKAPEAISSLCNSVYCRLIETQRLLVIKEVQDFQYHKYRGSSASTLAITEKAESLKEIISSELNNYAALSQSLDRSFPRRLITGTTIVQHDITNQLAALDEKRRELMEAGILDSEAEQPVAPPSGKLDDAIARVLQVHIDDNQKKLSYLNPLLKKIKLFKELIDQRFVAKDVRISKKKGIEVMTSNGEIGLDRLSSGEQHQLVLFFELLFEIRENSLILIDEPELSLHVAWQKKFIGDLLNIIDLNRFDVILATHSPQLISRWDELVVELGDVYGEELGPDDF
jgi:predicted ATP-binding protein involved in virulence